MYRIAQLEKVLRICMAGEKETDRQRGGGGRGRTTTAVVSSRCNLQLLFSTNDFIFFFLSKRINVSLWRIMSATTLRCEIAFYNERMCVRSPAGLLRKSVFLLMIRSRSQCDRVTRHGESINLSKCAAMRAMRTSV